MCFWFKITSSFEVIQHKWIEYSDWVWHCIFSCRIQYNCVLLHLQTSEFEKTHPWFKCFTKNVIQESYNKKIADPQDIGEESWTSKSLLSYILAAIAVYYLYWWYWYTAYYRFTVCLWEMQFGPYYNGMWSWCRCFRFDFGVKNEVNTDPAYGV